MKTKLKLYHFVNASISEDIINDKGKVVSKRLLYAQLQIVLSGFIVLGKRAARKKTQKNSPLKSISS